MSCDLDINQSAGSMVMKCPPVAQWKDAMESIYSQYRIKSPLAGIAHLYSLTLLPLGPLDWK